jgi:hypothetical protein
VNKPVSTRVDIPSRLTGLLQTGVVCGALLGFALIIYGWMLAPGISYLSLAGAAITIILYGLIGLIFLPIVTRINPMILCLATIFGGLAGILFALEIILEYVTLPTNNSLYGVIEFGSVFLLYFLVGAVIAYLNQEIRQALLAAVVSAVLSSLIWCIVLWLVFYVFLGSPQQAQVLLAEGDYADFARSGMQDFDRWLLEDFMGATFFHLFLGPLVAALLGVLGGLVGKGARIIIKLKVGQASARS